MFSLVILSIAVGIIIIPMAITFRENREADIMFRLSLTVKSLTNCGGYVFSKNNGCKIEMVPEVIANNSVVIAVDKYHLSLENKSVDFQLIKSITSNSN